MAIGLSLVFPALHAESGSARDQLVKNGIEYSEDGFVKCAGNGDIENVELIVAKGADANVSNNFGKTALMLAAENNQTEIAKVLIGGGAKVNDRDNHGKTPLFYALGTEANLETVKLLVENGANVGAKDKDLSGPMNYASLTTPEIVKYLIGKGADVNTRNTYGYKPLSNAINNNKPEIARILKEAGATQ
jgi:ankyrin repeat protein